MYAFLIIRIDPVALINSNVSLRTSVALTLVVVSFMSLIFSIFTTTYYTEKKNDDEAVRYIKAISKIVSFNSEIPLAFNQRRGLNEFLHTLKDIESLSNIHVYRQDDFSENLEFFTSFNKKSVSPVTPQFHRVKKLAQPVVSDEYIEYSLPVADSESNATLGYVYIRMSNSSFEQSITELAQYNLAMAVVLAIVAYVISLFIRSRVLSPISSFVKEIQDITFNKNFNTQVTKPNLVELQSLSESVNSMLKKIQQQIDKFEVAEQEITELNQNLEQKVVTRTQALRDSNQELLDALEQVHQYQSQVIQSEKMASLGQMVAGVAHEVNTPIGLGVTASTMLSDRIDEIQTELDNKSLSAKKLNRFLDESKENTQIIYRNLSRAADLVSSFKQVAVDQSADNTRLVKLESFVNEVILSLHPTLKKYQHQVQVNCDSTLEVKTKPGPINQVLINMIMNSLIHAFDREDGGVMTIDIWCNNNVCNIKYHDNGCGIEEKIKQRIFDPFVTTKRGEGGSGLGLHLVYNLITQALGGTIAVESELGQGATFNISFPVNVEGGDYVA